MKNVAIVFPNYGVGIISQDYNKAIEGLSNIHSCGLESILSWFKVGNIPYDVYDSKLVDNSVSYSPSIYTYISIQDGAVTVKNGSTYCHERSPASALRKALGIPFKAEKLYRFVYNGGTRAGQKRAVKVLEVHPTFIRAEDLDTGEARSYTVSKITEINELKL